MLIDTILPYLRKVTDGRIDYDKSPQLGITEVEEHIDTEATLFEATGLFHHELGPTDIDAGSTETLSYTATLPRNETELKTKLVSVGMNEEQAEACLTIQDDFELVRVFRHYGLAEPIFFNEYIWRCDPAKVGHALSQLEHD